MGVPKLTSYSRRPPSLPHNRVRYRQVDVRDLPSLRAALAREKPDLVFHLAAQRQPALAESRVAETISSNVLGTRSVLAAAGAVGVPSVVTASTGKALRYFASEVYASTKKLGEYLVAQAPARWGVATATTRFTHIVDNSVVYDRIRRWARSGATVRLHAPDIAFYVQSAREAAQLLVSTASTADGSVPLMTMLADIGWPLDLLELALDVIEKEGGRSLLRFAGYEPGYADAIYPGTFDPRRDDCSPLINVIEAERVVRAAHQPESIQRVELVPTHNGDVDDAIDALESDWRNGASDEQLRARLSMASIALLEKTLGEAPPSELEAILSLAADKVRSTREHRITHHHVMAAARTRGVVEPLVS
jgi:nucleoside-diphosphate-sugar epimerase